MTSPLRDYQLAAVDYLHARPSAGLWADMGLGKTAIVLTALTPDHLPALVVAPKRVAENVWEEERDLWRPDLSLVVAMGTQTQRGVALHRGADITVIGVDNMKDLLTAKPARPWRTLILDESSGFKSIGVRWRIARRLLHSKTATIEHCWQMTGTPSPNGLEGLWPQVYLLDRGKRLGTTLGEYRARYFTPGHRLPNGAVIGRVPRPGMDKKIHAKLEDLCLSLTTEGRVELPPITHNEVNITLPPTTVRAYRELKKNLVVNLEMLGGTVHTVANTAILTSKLSQLTAGFAYSDDYDLDGSLTQLHHEKTKAVVEIVEETGSPVLVFYAFQEELPMLQKALPQAVHINSPGAIKAWNRGEIPVLLAHPASAAHGLNLQSGGHTIVWTTLTWNLEHWEQANKRLHRSGQRNPVLIHRIMARSPSGARTVDHLIHARLIGKADVQTALIEYLEAPL